MFTPTWPISVACQDPCSQTAIGKNVGSVAVGIPRDHPVYGFCHAIAGTTGTHPPATPPVAVVPPVAFIPPVGVVPPVEVAPPLPAGAPPPLELPQPTTNSPVRTRRDAWFMLASRP